MSREASVHTLGIYTATDRGFTYKTRVVSDVWGHIRQPPPYTVPLISYVRLATC
jgi:hypothetical protein